jgi:hypothetical protein
LTLSAQTALTAFSPARDAACTPEQLQIAPRLKVAPVTFGALTAAAVD